MAYTLVLAVGFGSSKAGLGTVGYQLKNADGTNNGSRISGASIKEIGSGYYQASVSIPDLNGGILWDTGEGTPLYAYQEINSSPVDYIVDPVSVGAPAQANTCRMFLWAKNPDGTLMTTLATGVMSIIELPYLYSGSAFRGLEVAFTKHVDGYWYVDVVYGAKIRIDISEVGILTEGLVPSQTTKDIKVWVEEN